jgi:hypothetical protein
MGAAKSANPDTHKRQKPNPLLFLDKNSEGLCILSIHGPMTVTKITGVRGVSMGFQYFFELFFGRPKRHATKGV